MGKFNLKITNNETGEVLRDLDTDGIMGAVLLEEDEAVAGLCITSCHTMRLLNLLMTCDTVKEHQLENDPFLKMLYSLRDKYVRAEVVEENDQTEGEGET